MREPAAAFIGIGSNLEQPLTQVRTAVSALGVLPETRLDGVSAWYRSKPVGPVGQPDYINGVARIITTLSPLGLLAELQTIEDRQGRRRQLKWGPRTLDLDILLYGDCLLNEETLTVPHPRLAERNFVLLPLADIAPDLVLPGGTPLSSLLANCPSGGIVRLSDGE